LTCRIHLLRAAAEDPEGAICDSMAPDAWNKGIDVMNMATDTNPRQIVSA